MSLPVATPTSSKKTIQNDKGDIKSQDGILVTIQAHKQDTENFHLPTFLGNKIELKVTKNEQTLKEKRQPGAPSVCENFTSSTKNGDMPRPLIQENVSYPVNSNFFRNKYLNDNLSMLEGVSYPIECSSEKDLKELPIPLAIKINNPSIPHPRAVACLDPTVPAYHTSQISKAPSSVGDLSVQDKEEEKDNDIQ